MFKVDFVGVVCLFRDGDTERALVPDGQDAEPPHIARIVVDDPANVVAGAETWGERESDDVIRGEFPLPAGSIVIEGVDQPGELVSFTLDERLPRLSAAAPGFRVDPQSPNIWTSVAIRQGTLEVFRWPESADRETASVLTQLSVPNEGNYRVLVTDRDDPDRERFLELAAGTNLVIVNDSTSPLRAMEHFQIYDRLATSDSPTFGNVPPPTPPGIPALTTSHPFYDRPVAGDDLCPNTRP